MAGSATPKAKPASVQAPGAILREVEALPYERQLDLDLEFALTEGSKYFEEKSGLHQALRAIAQRLEKLGVPYALAGGMAMFMHGYRRFTEDVDILVGRNDIKRIHQALDGLGYRREFRNGKNLRDTEHNVKIEFLLSGDFPGDGKPKPVAFPEPVEVAVERGGTQVLGLPALVELKLASGMSSVDRARDLIDVRELIKVLGLPRDFAEQLNPWVRDKYEELWRSTRETGRRYVRVLYNQGGAPVKSLRALIDQCEGGDAELEAMLADGVVLEHSAEDEVYLVTTDPDVARKYDMHEESEMMPADLSEG